ncbi:sulfatase-like hydrolase/transferase [Saliphagus infecundisoli]|uniref:Sulfatase-like hydrolase/transferase n=1 Tax=Saliphagus infecundisoli TaxID=1849069 RepID=A0ABD5QGM6_9EURY|nr:sulfatase-like hydrolase/transferase [Saliphagus infecundisoli]
MGNGRANIVLVVMDTARESDTSYVRNTIRDSCLEELAATGAAYSNTFTNAPWTLPSHTSMFTGTYTSKHGTHAGSKFYDGQFPTIADLLSDDGYQTVGFTNNAWVTGEFGLNSGFDEMFKVWQYIQSETDFGKIKLTSDGGELIREGLSELVSGEIFANFINAIYGQFFYRQSDYGAKRTNSLVEKWIQNRDQDAPFFMFINYLEPHLDYQPPKRLVKKFLPEGSTYREAMAVPQKPWEYSAGVLEMTNLDFELLRALYRAEIAYLDEQIRELRSVFERYGEWDDTVFIIVGDHGENIGDHGLMDHQYSVHDTLLHVPLIIHGGRFNQVGDSDKRIQTLDLFPTILDIAGLTIPEQAQGTSFHPNSSTASRDQAIAEYLSPQPSIASLSDQTGIPEEELDEFGRSMRTIRTEEYKLIRGSEGDISLYNIEDDPNEQTDKSSEEPGVRDELINRLDAWLESFEQTTARERDQEMSKGTKQRLEDLGYI